LSDHEIWRATEESIFRFLVACRATPGLALSGGFAAARVARAAASGFEQTDSRFLGPATCGVIIQLQRGRASE
jgi:hypothetical protein